MTEILLRGGNITHDPKLDRIYPGLDAHWPSLNYLAVRGTPLEQKSLRSYTWNTAFVLDQGHEGRCVEYAICHELLARPVQVSKMSVDAILKDRSIYWPAQQEDEWEGGSYPGAMPFYEGTSVLSGMKVAARAGYFPEYRWGLDARDLAIIVGYRGPAVLGINWYHNMDHPDENGFVHATGGVAGGHAILCNSVKIRKSKDGSFDPDASYFGLHNSWGWDWGKDGNCKVFWNDMEKLIAEQGEVAIPVVRGKGTP